MNRKVLIESNGISDADWLRVSEVRTSSGKEVNILLYEGHWSNINPNTLQPILENLGIEVEYNEEVSFE